MGEGHAGSITQMGKFSIPLNPGAAAQPKRRKSLLVRANMLWRHEAPVYRHFPLKKPLRTAVSLIFGRVLCESIVGKKNSLCIEFAQAENYFSCKGESLLNIPANRCQPCLICGDFRRQVPTIPKGMNNTKAT